MTKIRIYIPFLLLISLVLHSCKSKQESMTVATYNLRYNTPKDGVNAWPNRKEKIISIITKYGFDVFGVQEVRPDQATDLVVMFPDYEYYGIGRNDGVEGEQAGLMYRKSRFEETGRGKFWLSPTPDVPSIGWDASVNRVAVWVKLKDKKTKKEFFFLSSHLDHMGKISRLESAKLLIEQIAKLAKDKPVFCVADYNAKPEENSICEMKSVFQDPYDISETEPAGPIGTLNLFDVKRNLTMRIDYIFVNEKVLVKSYKTIDDIIDGNYPSDHCPIMINAVLK